MKYYTLLFSIFWFIQCSKPFEDNSLVISQDQFTDALTDFYLYKNLNPSITQGARINYDDINGYILQKHNITPQEFKYSYGYYILDKNNAEEIFEDVENNLKELAPEYKEKQKLPE